MDNMDWYNTLHKPLFTPVSEAFAPAWTILYVLMFLSVVMLLRTGINRRKIVPIVLFLVQLSLNLIWPAIFFYYQDMIVALVVIVVLWIVLGFTIAAFWRHSKIAGALLIPYFAWVTFAVYLNAGFVILN